MPRYQELSESQMDDATASHFQRLQGRAARRGAAAGACLAAQPRSGRQRAQTWGACPLRARSSRRRQTEIAILMTARYWTAQFDRAAHVRLAHRGRAVCRR